MTVLAKGRLTVPGATPSVRAISDSVKIFEIPEYDDGPLACGEAGQCPLDGVPTGDLGGVIRAVRGSGGDGLVSRGDGRSRG